MEEGRNRVMEETKEPVRLEAHTNVEMEAMGGERILEEGVPDIKLL